ncbi:hypothetical protein CRM22_004406 [Opisthorchis felineus]|uniref:SCP domain-containing protein n=2 Tax=Opisthorchis felineus TaxID=147828 RepID=A0A4S2LWD0_OPIFE|nr:hypothetical protein CRM22_004406 [Opisthorchis felineus]
MVDTLLNNEGIALHNKLRERHGCGPLSYDSSLARSAQLWAEELATTKCMRHSDMATYGENLAYRCIEGRGPFGADEATKSWYDQGSIHDFGEGFTYETGYFSQLVWRDSKLVGFGRATSSDGTASYIVAHYSPKGNIRGRFQENVPYASRPITHSSLQELRPPGANSRPLSTLSSKELKEMEKQEKKLREKQEKERKELEKRMKKELKEREKLEKKERRKSKS